VICSAYQRGVDAREFGPPKAGRETSLDHSFLIFNVDVLDPIFLASLTSRAVAVVKALRNIANRGSHRGGHGIAIKPLIELCNFGAIGIDWINPSSCHFVTPLLGYAPNFSQPVVQTVSALAEVVASPQIETSLGIPPIATELSFESYDFGASWIQHGYKIYVIAPCDQHRFSFRCGFLLHTPLFLFANAREEISILRPIL
jgi:hypothetical protein